MEYLNRVHSSDAGIFEDEEGNKHYSGDRLEPYLDHINKNMFWGFDFDTTMLRVSSMNMALHGVNGANILYQDSLSKSIKENFLGDEITQRQQGSQRGQGFLAQLSKDLMAEFPEIKGFSKRNLEQIRRWYLFWNGDAEFAQQAATQFLNIPWWHNVVIVSKAQSHEEALFYVSETLAFGWSRSVLVHQIENILWQRKGKAITNFSQTLPSVQSDLAHQSLKDPYVFDFLALTKEHDERELENGLIKHRSGQI